MSDTPKSYADALEKAFLTPQTAPGSDESLWTKMDLCAQRCLGENRLVQIHPDELRKLISAARQAASPEARPDVSEGGEGETVPADVFNACMVRLGTLEAERDLAIAQRDEARSELARYKVEPCPDSDNGHFFDSNGVCGFCGKYDKENDLKLAAAADFKPGEPELEEIWERHSELMEVIECDMRDEKTLMNKRDFYKAAEEVARLRSLPSKPQSETRKAVENGS